VADYNGHPIVTTDSRIINLGQLNFQLNKVSYHAATSEAYKNNIHCNHHMILTFEQARHGLASIIVYHCLGCGQSIQFATSTRISSPEGNRYWTCNLAAVWGQMATGGGYNDLQESMSMLGVPVMAKKTFITTEKRIVKWWWDLLQESMCAAGEGGTGTSHPAKSFR